jgi:hypothetical protein
VLLGVKEAILRFDLIAYQIHHLRRVVLGCEINRIEIPVQATIIELIVVKGNLVETELYLFIGYELLCLLNRFATFAFFRLAEFEAEREYPSRA